MRWSKRCKWKVNYRGFTYEYDTASELGAMVRDSGSGMPNPYEPDCTDYDDYNEEMYK